MVSIQIGRDISNNFEEFILNPLLEFFKNKKEYRTIKDVEEAIEFLAERNDLEQIKQYEEEELREEINNIKDSIDDYLEKNRENIALSFKNPKTKIMMTYWITNFDLAMTILFEALNLVTKQKRKVIVLQRQSKYTKQYIGIRLFNILKAVFLVLFRIVEQIFLIINNEDFNPDQEIDYLVGDVVYLKNIQRKNKLLNY